MSSTIPLPVEKVTSTRDFAWVSLLAAALVYAVFAAVEITFHWYAGTQDTPTAHFFRRWYLDHNSIGKFPNAPLVDLFWPAIVLGLVTGSITSGRSVRGVGCCVLLLCLGILALFPLYPKFFPGTDSWLSSLSNLSATDWMIHLFFPPLVFILFIGGMFTILGRLVTQRLRGRLDQTQT